MISKFALPPMIVDIKDRMAWAAYVAFQVTDPVDEETKIDYSQFKTERMRWDAVAHGVMDAAATFVNEVRHIARTHDGHVDPHAIVIEAEDRASHPSWQMLCDYCGMTKINAAENRLTHCAPPFDVKPHEWTGRHPYHKRQTLKPLLDAVSKAENAYFRSKEGPRASTFEGRSDTQHLLNVWDAAKAALAEGEKNIGVR